MSRAGRASGSVAKKRELHARLQAAVVEHQAAAEAEAPPPEVPENVQSQWDAIPPEARRAWRAQRIFALCKNRIVVRDRALWPADMVGALLAEEWLRLLQQCFMEDTAAQMRAAAEAAGIELPA